MKRARLIAALAAIITALLFQATLIAPVTDPFALSLPAVLVAAVALMDGPAPGMSFGFAAGLVADLGSQHPAGLLALCWLGIGLVCGAVADRHSLRRDALTAGIVCAVASTVASVLMAVVHASASVSDAVVHLLPTVAGDVLLAVPVIALVRRMLRTDSLRAPHPVYTDILVGAGRG